MSRRFCFVIMPFRSHLDSVFTVIKAAADRKGLDCMRGDMAGRGGFVLTDIIECIKMADVVVADLTGRNPNVFYETGMAHILKEARQVVLIAQREGDVPFDLRALRFLRYASTTPGRKKLAQSLDIFIGQALKDSPGEQFETIEGKLERTRRIVADYRALLEAGGGLVRSLVIRIRAGLSSLAIDNSEARGTKGDEHTYRRLLLEERNLLIELLHEGAQLKAILTPPTVRFWERSELAVRYQRLIELLERDRRHPDNVKLPHARCSIVLCPLLTNNIAILGERVIYEGTKASLSGGFEITSRVTHAGFVRSHVQAFDSLFKDARTDTLRRYPPPRRGDLGKAVVIGLKTSMNSYLDNSSSALE